MGEKAEVVTAARDARRVANFIVIRTQNLLGLIVSSAKSKVDLTYRQEKQLQRIINQIPNLLLQVILRIDLMTRKQQTKSTLSWKQIISIDRHSNRVKSRVLMGQIPSQNFYLV
mmetsp:Transcript_36380/g.74161  ORF Transcript_36380/g.74161 Transcript_36380/m.74161 type:complete len:114 (-) Transcript_36380:174-515(-)